MEVINIDKDSVLLLNTQANEIQININKCKVLITDITSANKNIMINDGSLEYFYIKKTEGNVINNIDVYNSEVRVKIIDILDCSGKNEYGVCLEDENSNLDISVASISRLKASKEYKINTKNNQRHTSAKIDCFGIVEDTSLLKYDITSFIKKGAKQSVVNQSSKILLFDKESIGINNPILEIEENDVKANHGSSIGMIDEETLFYLTSRGIKEDEARKLVSLGKINYIIEEIKDEKLKEELLEEMIGG